MGYWNGAGSLGMMAGIAYMSNFSIGRHMVAVSNATPSNATWQTANRAIFIPFVVPATAIARKMTSGAAATSGNIDVGIYNAQGVRLSSSGSTVEAGNPQTIDIPDVTLYPGNLYYMAMNRSGTGGVVNLVDLGTQYYARIMGIAKVDLGSVVLPATVTLAQTVSQFIPAISVLFEAISA